MKPNGDFSHITWIYWSSGYDPRAVFYNYPDLTAIQEMCLIYIFNHIISYKGKMSKGNVFPVVP